MSVRSYLISLIGLTGGPDGFPGKEAFPNVHEIYNKEAKTYDTAMVERWKTAMEGLLIFVSP